MSVVEEQIDEQIIEVVMPPMHKGQRVVRDDPHRFRVLAAGRRWGKTRLGAALCVATACAGGRAWWVAPTYPLTQVGWRETKALSRSIPGVEIREGDRIIHFPTGGWVQVKSADGEGSLRGEGLDFAVLDECAFMQERAWQEELRPALSDREGRALFISTPKGQNWFWRLSTLEDVDRNWTTYRFRTRDNPYINPDEVEAASRDLPEAIFRQEYEAEFIADGSGVFRRVSACAVLPMEMPEVYAGTFVMGVDWGMVNDFTVVVVLDAKSGQVVDFDRFNQIDWHIQRTRLRAMAERWRAGAVLVESNSIGGPQASELRREHLAVQEFTTTQATKRDVIENLALGMEQGNITFPPIPALVNELTAYQSERLPSGQIRYGAPEGMHDDCVMALALAYQAMRKGGGVGVLPKGFRV